MDKSETLDREKEIQYYAASVNAWFGTRLEHDKSLLTLSAGGVGLLITLLSTVGIRSVESLILYIVSIISFLICLVSILWIFKRNANHLENVNQNQVGNDVLLHFLDSTAFFSFLIGVLLASIIGISAAIISFNAGDENMTRNKNLKIVNDSFNGTSNMRPAESLIKKSFDGAVAMKPAPPPIQQPSQVPEQTQNTNSKKEQ